MLLLSIRSSVYLMQEIDICILHTWRPLEYAFSSCSIRIIFLYLLRPVSCFWYVRARHSKNARFFCKIVLTLLYTRLDRVEITFVLRTTLK